MVKSGVYIIINETTGYIKIGESKNIDNRLNQIRNSLRFSGKSDSVYLYYYEEVKLKKNRCMMETYLHNKYSIYNVMNEWFDCDYEDVKQTMQSYKKAMNW